MPNLLHVNTMPHSAGYVIADARDLQRVLALTAKMYALLQRIADIDPIADNPDEGDACHFCGADRPFADVGNGPHAKGCEWADTRTLLTTINGK